MPMGVQNRNDPFVIIILARNSEIEQERLNMARNYMKYLFMSLITLAVIILFASIFKRPLASLLTTTIPIFLLIIFTTGLIQTILKGSTISEVDNIVKSDKYAVANVNVEMLFNLIERQNTVLGKFQMMNTIWQIQYITYLFFIIGILV